MADILPEPVSNDVLYNQAKTGQVTSRHGRRTFWILLMLVVVAVICLILAVVYDVVHNHDLDNTRKKDLTYISTQLEGYFDAYNFYPTLTELNSNAFSVFNLSLNRSYFHDPSATSRLLSQKPSVSSYAYEVSPAACDNIKSQCKSYKLIAILSSNKQYIVTSKH